MFKVVIDDGVEFFAVHGFFELFEHDGDNGVNVLDYAFFGAGALEFFFHEGLSVVVEKSLVVEWDCKNTEEEAVHTAVDDEFWLIEFFVGIEN